MMYDQLLTSSQDKISYTPGTEKLEVFHSPTIQT